MFNDDKDTWQEYVSVQRSIEADGRTDEKVRIASTLSSTRNWGVKRFAKDPGAVIVRPA